MDEKDCERFLECLKEFNNKNSVYIRDIRESRKNRHPMSGDSLTSDVCSLGNSAIKLVEVFCYCLMPNHYHLILKELLDGGITKFMRKLNSGYTKYFNIKHQRSGHLFEGKYKYKEVDADFYLTHLTGYIHINPVRAGIVQSPRNYKYSSYLDYIGNKQTDFLDFRSEELEVKIENYEEFVSEMIKDEEVLARIKVVGID